MLLRPCGSIDRPGTFTTTVTFEKSAARTTEAIDLLAGGVPCPPFSIAGKQLGADDERDLFPEALRLVKEANPSAVMLENVKGLALGKILHIPAVDPRRP